jgi:hypothetical protein
MPFRRILWRLAVKDDYGNAAHYCQDHQRSCSVIGVLLLAAVGLWTVTLFALVSIFAVIVGVSHWLSTRKAKSAKTVDKPVDNQLLPSSRLDVKLWDLELEHPEWRRWRR